MVDIQILTVCIKTMFLLGECIINHMIFTNHHRKRQKERNVQRDSILREIPCSKKDLKLKSKGKAHYSKIYYSNGSVDVKFGNYFITTF